MSINGTALAVTSFGGLLLYSAVKGAGIADTARSLLAGQAVDQTNPVGGWINGFQSAASTPQTGTPGTLANLSSSNDPSSLLTIPGGSATGVKAMRWAEQQIGKPYKWGATGPNAFDCSGLVYAAYRAVGVKIPRLTTASFLVSPKFKSVPRNWASIQAGDLVFPFSGHVVLVVDPTTHEIVEAPHPGVNVRHANYSEFRTIFAVRRYRGN